MTEINTYNLPAHALGRRDTYTYTGVYGRLLQSFSRGSVGNIEIFNVTGCEVSEFSAVRTIRVVTQNVCKIQWRFVILRFTILSSCMYEYTLRSKTVFPNFLDTMRIPL